MLHYNPQKRPSASQALQHPYFQVSVPVAEEVLLNRSTDHTEMDRTSWGIKNARYRPGVVCKLFE